MQGSLDENRLVALLVEKRMVSKRQIREVLEERSRTQKPLDTVLLEMKLVSPTRLKEIQAQVMGMEYIRVADKTLDPRILKILPKRYATEHRAIPISLESNTLTIAMEHPTDVRAIDEIKMLTGYQIKAVVCGSNDVDVGLSVYPEMNGAEKEKVPVSKLRHTLEFLGFMALLIIPLGILVMTASRIPQFQNWLVGNGLDYSNSIFVMILWGFYAILLYYLYNIFFNRPPETTEEEYSSTENKSPESENIS